MSDLSGYRDDTDEALNLRMRKYPVGSADYVALQGELSQRVALAQLRAAKAQIRSAWYQLAAVTAAAFGALATLVAPMISK